MSIAVAYIPAMTGNRLGDGEGGAGRGLAGPVWARTSVKKSATTPSATLLAIVFLYRILDMVSLL
jgi:hypothetical protein